MTFLHGPWPLVAGTALALLLSVCDAKGKTIDLRQRAPAAALTPGQHAPAIRLALLDADLLDIAQAMGLSSQIVVAPDSADSPVQPALIFKQGVTAEALAAQTPDLVIASNPGDSRRLLERLKIYKINAQLIDRALPAPEKIRRFGALVGRQTDAEVLARRIERDYASVAARPPLQPAPRVIFISTRGGGAGRVSAAGSGTPANQLIQRAGASNVIADAGLHSFRSLSTEALIAVAPEVVIVADDELATLGGEEGIWLQVSGLAQTPAALKRQLIVMRSEDIRHDATQSGVATLALRDALESLQ
ncbi:MAG: ABC transporter substrate-binding protein [Scandinavium sp.]|uniref:ABC transporter substrate-binding protein n=1 Tax=Scandinavium sp. TaxID=2830653 RepID=UPI003F3E6EF7